jgi:hypothetical protein
MKTVLETQLKWSESELFVTRANVLKENETVTAGL